MMLVDVYRESTAVDVLYSLLKERPKESRISHARMPTRAQHRRFVESKPYRYWYLIEPEPSLTGFFVGDIHVTDLNEIGIFLFESEQNRGYGGQALRLFLRRHKPLPAIPAKRVARWLAHVAPGNMWAKVFFRQHGFDKVQETFAI